MTRDPLAFVVLGLLLLSGCGGGDGLARVALSGSVTSGGSPVPNGVIRFVPATGTEGPIASGMITSGRYDIPGSQGPVAGNYEARIQVYDDPNASGGSDQPPTGGGKMGPKTSSGHDPESSGDEGSEATTPPESKRNFNVTIPPLSSFSQDFTL